MLAMAQGGVTMPEAVWEMQSLLMECQVQFCPFQETDEDREVPFLAKWPPNLEGCGRGWGQLC